MATRVPGEIELRSIPVGFCLNYWVFFLFFLIILGILYFTPQNPSIGSGSVLVLMIDWFYQKNSYKYSSQVSSPGM